MGMPKKAVFATAGDVNIGDKVRVVRATYGAAGADNQVGVIVDGDYNDVHGCTQEARVLVKLLSGTVWNVGPDAIFEIMERCTKDNKPCDEFESAQIPEEITSVCFQCGYTRNEHKAKPEVTEEFPKLKIYKHPYPDNPNEVITMRHTKNKEHGLFGAEGGLAKNVGIGAIFVEENGDVQLFIY